MMAGIVASQPGSGGVAANDVLLEDGDILITESGENIILDW